jgi:predicted ABC-type ATPase
VRLRIDGRPLIVAIAGPNGAGKSTFYRAHCQALGLSFVNADQFALEPIVKEAEPDRVAYAAAELASKVRKTLVAAKESFVFETVLSDPIGDKIHFLRQTADSGYNVVLCFIGLASSSVSIERVAMRVAQGGHDVPNAKLLTRFDRTLTNLGRAINTLPYVAVFDNSDLRYPLREIAEFDNGGPIKMVYPIPSWLETARQVK